MNYIKLPTTKLATKFLSKNFVGIFANSLHRLLIVMRKILSKLRTLFKRIFCELKDPLNIVVYLIVVVIFFSPTIVGYIMVLCGANPAHVAWATAYVLFWAGPFTPAIPIQLVITFAIARPLRRLINYIKYRRKIRWLL